MAIADDLTSREQTKFIESTSVSGKPGVVVLNPDGSNIGAGTGATSLGKAEDSAHSSGDTGVAILAKRTDTAAVSSGTDGDYSTVNVDSSGALWARELNAPAAEDNTNAVIATQNKPLAVSTYAWSVDQSTALEASSVTKASAGVFRSISGRVDSTHSSGNYYLQILNASSLPADGAVTTLIAPIKINHTSGTNTTFSADATMNGVFASTGIVWCLSTTEFTKTISWAFVSATVLFK